MVEAALAVTHFAFVELFPSSFLNSSIGSHTLIPPPIDNIEKLSPCFLIRFKAASYTARHGLSTDLLNPPHHHTKMATFYHHTHTQWLQGLYNCIHNLTSETLLHLQPSRVHFCNPCNFGQTDDCWFGVVGLRYRKMSDLKVRQKKKSKKRRILELVLLFPFGM